jgi:hypothetical protein
MVVVATPLTISQPSRTSQFDALAFLHLTEKTHFNLENGDHLPCRCGLRAHRSSMFPAIACSTTA